MIALSIQSERNETCVDGSSIRHSRRGAGTSAGDECVVWELLYTATNPAFHAQHHLIGPRLVDAVTAVITWCQ